MGSKKRRSSWFKVMELEERIVLTDGIVAVDPGGGTGGTGGTGGGGGTGVSDPNNISGITFVSTPLTSAAEGSLYSYDVNNAPTTGTVTFTLDQASIDRGMTINSSTGLIQWVPSETDGGKSFSVVVRATNGFANSTQSFNINVAEVNQLPFVSSLELEGVLQGSFDLNQPVQLVEGETITLTFADNDIIGPLNQPDATSVAIISGFEAGMSTANGIFSWTPSSAGSYSVELQVTDGLGGISTQLVLFEVLNATNLSIDPIPDAQASEGALFSLQVNTVGANGNNLTFSLDQDSLDRGLLIDNGGVISWSPSEADGGSDFDVTVTVSDGVNPAVSDTFHLTVEEDNQDPIATNDAGSLLEGSFIDLNLLGNDSDADLPANILSVVINQEPMHGSLSVNLDGTLRYTHDGSENFSDSFTYQVSDGLALSDVATVTLNISPVNDNAPVAANDMATVDEGGAVVINVKGNDSDLDGDLLQLIVVDAPLHGSLLLNSDGTITYQHDGSENFADSFTYKLNDGVRDSDIATVDITINPVNDNAPLAANDMATVDEGGAVVINVKGNDSDLDGDLLQLIVVDAPLHGSLLLNSDGTITYQHDGSENFADSFTYKLNDGVRDSDIATVDITINPVNDNAPVGTGESYAINQGGIVNGNLLDNDSDADLPNDMLRAELNLGPLHGALSLNSDGTFSYQHDGSANLSDSFSYKVIDLEGNFAIATVTISISAISEDPSIEFLGRDNKVYIENHKAVQIAPAVMVGDNDSTDFAGGSLTVSISGNGEASDRLIFKENGSFDIRNGNQIYLRGKFIGTFSGGDGLNPLVIQLNANADSIAVAKIISRIGYYNTSDAPSTLTREFSFVLNDGDGGLSAAAFRHMRVVSVNDAPEILSAAEYDTVARGSWDDIGMDLGLQITDPDANDDDMMEVSLKVAHGILAFSDVSDLETVVFGRKVNLDGSKQITFTASLEEANILLTRLMYKVTDKAKTDTLWIRVNDLGNDGMLCGGQKDWDAFRLKIA